MNTKGKVDTIAIKKMFDNFSQQSLKNILNVKQKKADKDYLVIWNKKLEVVCYSDKYLTLLWKKKKTLVHPENTYNIV